MEKLERWERFKDARINYNQHGKQTMKQVADAVKLSQSTISDLENGEKDRRVNCEDVIKLAAHYGVSTDYLLGLSDDPRRVPGAVDELGLPYKAVSRIRRLRADAENADDENSPHARSFDALRLLLSSDRLRPVLLWLSEAVFAAQQAKSTLRGVIDALPDETARKFSTAVFRKNSGNRTDGYKYRQYLAAQEYSALLDALCGVEEIEALLQELERRKAEAEGS